MTSHFVFVPGKPVAKARPRVTMRGGKPRAYTPKKTADFEAMIRDHWRGFPIMEGPLHLSIVCYLEIPQSWSKKKKTQAEHGEIEPTSRPDIDNYAKLVMDALNGIAYNDDSQVVRMIISKMYSERPGILISLQSSIPRNT